MSYNKNVSNQNALTVDNLNVNVSATINNLTISGFNMSNNLISNNQGGLTIGDSSTNLITSNPLYYLNSHTLPKFN